MEEGSPARDRARARQEVREISRKYYGEKPEKAGMAKLIPFPLLQG
jgi:hypothetical protein